jgi:DNA topoisomerase I
LEKYTLIITEKPDAANRIATALDVEGKPKKTIRNGVPTYLAYRNGNLVVVPALGHLYTIMDKEKKKGYPVFDYQWVPRYLAERGASRIKAWLKVISDLAKDAEGFVDACDFDIEGSIIGYTILKYACNGKESAAKRMKYSTLTKEDLIESFSQLQPNLDFQQIQAGLTRHEVDWLCGINLSRALTQAAKNYSGQYTTLSTGRVQGPTLKFVEEREKTINCFVPTPYWTLTAKIALGESVFVVEYEKTLENKAKAMNLRNACKTKEGKIETVTVEEFLQKPPAPFDLGALQSEAYRIFKYTPIRTSSIAQKLYTSALISYPRTSSQKLPESIGYKNILKKLSTQPAYSKLSTDLLTKKSLKANEGAKFDPAHPAIYPTGNQPEKSLDTAERNIFDLVVKRFFAVFGDSAVQQNIKVKINLNDHFFNLNVMRTLKEGWMQFYKPYCQAKDIPLPPLSEGEKVTVKRVNLTDGYSKPPTRYNPRSLLLNMEKEEIGTKATRAATIQTLYDRRYVTGTNNLAISDLGFTVVEVLSMYCPTVVSPEMTRTLEERMEAIQQGKETKQNVLQDTVENLKMVMSALKDKEPQIGADLFNPIQQGQLEKRTIGTCPKCKEGKLVIMRSKKTGKRFVGCSNYFKDAKCNQTFPLPQTGTIKPSGNVCKRCGSPIINVYQRNRYPWKLCLNMDCPTKGDTKK